MWLAETNRQPYNNIVDIAPGLRAKTKQAKGREAGDGSFVPKRIVRDSIPTMPTAECCFGPLLFPALKPDAVADAENGLKGF